MTHPRRPNVRCGRDVPAERPYADPNVETPRWSVSSGESKDVSAERLYDVSDWEDLYWKISTDWRRPAELPGFKCVHCRNQVAGESWRSGVVNRNHCPYCLHSRHLDLLCPGDRLAACKAPMAPIGLTLKRTRKKYGPESGELMLVHLCRECGKLSLNRIAADDDNQRLLGVYQASLNLENRLRDRLRVENIDLLDEDDRMQIERQLLGQPALAGELAG